MSAAARITLSVLTETVERAQVLEPGLEPSETLGRAFGQGVVFLEAVDGGAAPPSEFGAASDPGAPAWRDAVADRASWDVLRHRALVLTEQNRRLDDSVDGLATESRGLHDELWEWHERAGRLKLALGRRRRVTPRPEPALMIGTGGPGKNRPGPGERLLGGARRCEVELALPGEQVQRAEALALRHGWQQDWGDDWPLVPLAHGLAVLELERGSPAAPPGPPSHRPGGLPPLDVIRNRIFDLSGSIRILEIRETAFRIDNRGMRLRLAQLQDEVAALEQELAERGGEQHAPSPGPGFLARLLRRPRP